MGKTTRVGTRKLGWCLTGHHEDCWYTVSDLKCECDCHDDNNNGENNV